MAFSYALKASAGTRSSATPVEKQLCRSVVACRSASLRGSVAVGLPRPSTSLHSHKAAVLDATAIQGVSHSEQPSTPRIALKVCAIITVLKDVQADICSVTLCSHIHLFTGRICISTYCTYSFISCRWINGCTCQCDHNMWHKANQSICELQVKHLAVHHVACNLTA